MGILDINLGNLSRVQGSINSAVNELDRRQSDYEGIMRNVSGISSSSGNLSDCNIYLRKKNSQLQDKIDRLTSFSNRISAFSSDAKAADSRVATYVTDQSEIFYKTVGIKTGWAAGWESFQKGCKAAWKWVKDFYEEHKFVIDFVVDALFVVAAVVAVVAAVPTGGASLFFAGFGLAQAAGDLFTSSVALEYHIQGDDEQAGIWAERGLRDGVKWVGDKIDEKFGVEGVSNVLGFAYDVVSLASIGYSAGKTGKELFKSIDLRNTNDMSVLKRFTNAGKQIFGLNATGTDVTDLKGCISIKYFFGLKTLDSARRLQLGCDFLKNTKNVVGTVDSIYNGTFFTAGNDIGNTVTQTIDTVKSGYNELNSTPAYAYGM